MNITDTDRLNWLETHAIQLPAMMGAPETLHVSLLAAGAKTVREAIDARIAATKQKRKKP